MKKLITSVFLVFGLYSNSFSQTDTCKVDYYNMFNTDSIVSIWGNSDASYNHFTNCIFKRYQGKLLELYQTNTLYIELEGENWFKISRFFIYTSERKHVYFTPCQMEELFK